MRLQKIPNVECPARQRGFLRTFEFHGGWYFIQRVGNGAIALPVRGFELAWYPHGTYITPIYMSPILFQCRVPWSLSLSLSRPWEQCGFASGYPTKGAIHARLGLLHRSLLPTPNICEVATRESSRWVRDYSQERESEIKKFNTWHV